MGGGSCIIPPAESMGELLMAFNCCPVPSDLRSTSLWEEDGNFWCILDVMCQEEEKHDGQHGNLLKLLRRVVPGFSFCLGEFFNICFKMSHRPRLWLWGEMSFFFFFFLSFLNCLHTVMQLGVNLLLSNDVWLRGRGRAKKVIWSTFLFEPQSANRIPPMDWEREKIIHLNWIKSNWSHNGKGLFSVSLPLTITIPLSVPLSLNRE